MKTNCSLLFYLKKRSSYKSGPISIYLRITIDGGRVELATGRKCDPSRWNSAAGRANGTKEEIRSLNSWLSSIEIRIYEIIRELNEAEEFVSAEVVRSKFLGKDSSAKMLLEVFCEHNRKIEALVGGEYASGTLQRYETTLKHTRDFIKEKYKLADIDITRVDYYFITEFEFYLRSVRKCGNNSAVKYVKNFKKIIRICIASGWLDKDPFINYKAKVKSVDRAFLTEEELKTIAEQVFEVERLNYVKDVFLFSCYTGLAYADVQKLKKSEVVKGHDGESWINTKRKKTDTSTRVPLLPAALELINKYKSFPPCVNSGKVFPVSSNQKMNAYLKEIAAVCGITKTLTYHIARHTFATTVTLTNGVPIESVSKMLGHTSIKTTQHYAKILDMKVGADMEKLRSKYK
ncbi:site-specific integrase [Desertivirga brevis]|uniref:site-specific integrase n=1 Tax=Desertivirga brevis TaxID=2810310 RepID=UPI001A972CB7|nr:site-specific integrase [Pedobacter sp. SYSU D00873]